MEEARFSLDPYHILLLALGGSRIRHFGSLVGWLGTSSIASPPARSSALVGGNLDLAVGDIASSQQFVENGDLLFLATGATERVEQTPDVPTFSELGADLDLANARGIVMPKSTPEDVQATLESALRELSQDETFIQQINNAGAEVRFRGQEEYTEYLSNLSETVDRLAGFVAP